MKKRLVKGIVVVGDQSALFGAKGDKGFCYLGERGSVFDHRIADVVNSCGFRGDGDAWIDELDKGTVFDRVKSG